jgi:hypothetical protein
VVVGAGDGGCAHEANIYDDNQMAFVVESTLYADRVYLTGEQNVGTTYSDR